MKKIMFVILLCCFSGSSSSSVFEESKVICKEEERHALLEIKACLVDIYKKNVLSSWGDIEEEKEAKRECCEWIGVRCNKRTGNVVSLDLSRSIFNNTNSYYYSSRPGVDFVNSSLVHLEYLNLNGVNFNETSIPSFIGDLTKLRYLDLSSTSLAGKIPPQLGNLSSLKFLDLSYNKNLGGDSLDWSSSLSSLQVLDLSYTNMTSASDWFQVFSNLPQLTKLALKTSSLPKVVIPSSLALLNSTKVLAFLDLSGNSLSGSIFQWLFNFNHSLVHLDLSDGLLSYFIPRAFERMTSLEYLSLSSNLLGSLIQKSLGNITTLKHLDLSNNKFEGSIPESFGNMSNLGYLDLKKNMLVGEIPRSIWRSCTLKQFQARHNNLTGQLYFSQSPLKCSHSSLEYLHLSQNQITGTLPNFTLYPSLIEMSLSSNRFIGNVSQTIGQLSKLEVLDINENSLNGVMSEVHFLKLSSLYHLDLSDNPSLVFNISSYWIPSFQLETINLGYCQLGPLFPKWLQTQRHITNLDISHSQISDHLPDWFWYSSTDFEHIDLSNNKISGSIRDQHSLFLNSNIIDLSSNQFEGSIPLFLLQARASYLSHNKFSSLSSMCNASDYSSLSLLDVSFNQLVGELPDCWFHFNALEFLNLRNNNLSGNIPNSLSVCSSSIKVLNLGCNRFTGNMPESLSSSLLVMLDVAENRLEGPVPEWIGALESLVILILRSNRFNGSFPSSLCRLRYIQLIDLSSNYISKKIPNCVGNLTAMRKDGNLNGNRVLFEQGDSATGIYLLFGNIKKTFAARVTIMWKGKLSQYKNTLRLVKSINLSDNKLVGKIPLAITELNGLIALDLSRNSLSGQIPTELFNLKSLEVLDLSRNHLYGNIPSSLSVLNFMSMLDVSNNNLSGKIPTSTQLQSFDPSSYSGNLELCGAPLPKKCLQDKHTTFTDSLKSRHYSKEDEDSFITRGLYVSLGLGFAFGFCGYFMLFNGKGDWLYLKAVLYKAKLLRILKH